jgi:hypothetical protein
MDSFCQEALSEPHDTSLVRTNHERICPVDALTYSPESIFRGGRTPYCQPAFTSPVS